GHRPRRRELWRLPWRLPRRVSGTLPRTFFPARRTSMRLTSTLALAVALAGCGAASKAPPASSNPSPVAANETEINPQLLRRFKPILGQGGSAAVTPEKVALGRML